MSTTLPRVDDASDAELISAVRGGDVDAYGELFGRHVDAARRLARQLVPHSDADDLVSEAFAKVLGVLQRGGGPDLAFRAYLLTAVRRLHVDRIRSTSRLHHTDDLTPFDPGVPFRDTAVEGFENAAAARAFASLPERWQLVLWHTEVEGQKPAEVAPLLGLSPNSVSALAYRAREGLRQAFLSMHAQEVLDASCSWSQEHLGAYVRGGLSRRDALRVETHLRECRRCAAVYLELTELNSDLAAVLAPLLLGGAAAAYLASAGGGAAAGGLFLLLDRVRDFLVGHAPATAAAGIVTTAVVAGLVIQGLGGPDEESGVSARTAPATSAQPSAARDPKEHPDHRAPQPSPHTREQVVATAVQESSPPPPVSTPPGQPAPSPPASTTPGDDAGDDPGQQPSDPPPSDGSDGADLAVAASASPSSGLAFRVEVVVTGLPPGGAATLDVTADHTSVAIAPDPRCAGLAVGRPSCSVSDSPTTFTFVVAAPPDAPTTLTFTVQPQAPTTESDPSDNSTQVVLTP